MLATCLHAGLRRAELLSLKFVDADVDNLTIFVRCGKGRKDRMIPMSFTLANILRNYLKERGKIKTIVPELFITRDGRDRVRLNSFNWFINRFRRISGINFTLHKLRHTFATLMIEGGCDIYSLSKMMGHSDITTTTIYLAASIEHLRSQIAKHPLG
jgi:site-specific recombinase XerD